MIANLSYLPGALASGTVPGGLIVEPTHAWVLLVTLLAVCCGVLWFLTRPVPATFDRGPTRQRPRRRRRDAPFVALEPRMATQRGRA